MEFVPAPRTIRLLCAASVVLLALPGSSAVAAPQAKIGPVDCDAGGSVVTLSNDAGGPARFVVLRDDVAIATVVVPAGTVGVRRVVPIAEGAAAQVTARYGGSYVSGYVRRGCEPTTQTAAAVAAARADIEDTPNASAPVIPATGSRAIVPATAPVTATATAPAASERATDPARSSAWMTLLFLAIATVALAAVARMLSRGRRSETPAAEPATRPTRSAG